MQDVYLNVNNYVCVFGSEFTYFINIFIVYKTLTHSLSGYTNTFSHTHPLTRTHNMCALQCMSVRESEREKERKEENGTEILI